LNGAHFAFSHLWWAIAYPIAGYMGSHFPENDFFYGGILTLTGGLLAIIIFYPIKNRIRYSQFCRLSFKKKTLKRKNSMGSPVNSKADTKTGFND